MDKAIEHILERNAAEHGLTQTQFNLAFSALHEISGEISIYPMLGPTSIVPYPQTSHLDDIDEETLTCRLAEEEFTRKTFERFGLSTPEHFIVKPAIARPSIVTFYEPPGVTDEELRDLLLKTWRERIGKVDEMLRDRLKRIHPDHPLTAPVPSPSIFCPYRLLYYLPQYTDPDFPTVVVRPRICTAFAIL